LQIIIFLKAISPTLLFDLFSSSSFSSSVLAFNKHALNIESKIISFNVHSQFSFDDPPNSEILNPDYEILPEGYFRVYTSMEKLLAQYFDIDLNKVEKERRQMLEELRKYHEEKEKEKENEKS